MKTKSTLLLLTLGILFIAALSSVSAVVVYGEWEDGSQSTIITDGEDIDFNVDFFTMNPPMTVTIKLFDQQNKLIHTFENNTVINNPEFARDYTLKDSMYSGTGNYLVSLVGRDAYGSFSQSLNLNVQPKAPTNSAPKITSTAVTSVDETCPNQQAVQYTYNVDATDADGDTLVYSLLSGPTWLTINANTGLITGTVPSVSSDTQFTITVKVSDGEASDTQTFVLTVKNRLCEVPNKAPEITSTAITLVDETCPNQQAVQYNYDVNAIDADSDTLTYSLLEAPTWLSINSATGLISGTVPSVSSDTQFTITVKVSDGKGGTDTQTYTLTVKNRLCDQNRNPEITSNPVTTLNEICPNEATPYSYDVNAIDADGDILTYSLLTAPAWLTINENTGFISGTAPAVSADTQFSVSVKVSDGKGGSDTQTYTLTIKNCVQSMNHPPVIVSTPVTIVNERAEYRYDVDAIDPDNDVLVYSLVTAPSWLSINSVTGLISGTAPEVNADTNFTVSVKATDPHGASDTQTYTLTVKNIPSVNRDPVITTSPVTPIGCACLYIYDVDATDTDGDRLTFSLETAPAWLSINSSTGVITGTTPEVNSNTSFTVIVKVSDGKGGTDTQTYTLVVTNRRCPGIDNRAPVINTNPVMNVNERSKYTYDVNATDPDGDTITYSISQLPGTPAWLTINPNTGLISGTAPSVTHNTWTFQVTVLASDGKGGSHAQIYNLVVHGTDSSSGSSNSISSSGSASFSLKDDADMDGDGKFDGTNIVIRQPIISQERAQVSDEKNNMGLNIALGLSIIGAILIATLVALAVYSKKEYITIGKR